MLSFFKEVFNHFFDSNTFQKGASLAYYAVFSFLPMIMIVTSLLGMFLGEQAVSGEIFAKLRDTLGDEASIQIQNIIKSQHTNHNNVLTSIIGFATLALSATGLFNQVHSSFNSIWNIKSKPKSSVLNYLSKHLSAFLILIGLFFIVLVSSGVNAFLVHYSSSLHSDHTFTYLYEHLLSFVVLGLVFTLMFNYLGDAKIYWKATVLGGLFTAFLFLFGKVGIAMYIGHSHISSTFGSASVLALLMLWVYYISQIIFLGASFVKVVSRKLGQEIRPNSNAVSVEHVEVER